MVDWIAVANVDPLEFASANQGSKQGNDEGQNCDRDVRSDVFLPQRYTNMLQRVSNDAPEAGVIGWHDVYSGKIY